MMKNLQKVFMPAPSWPHILHFQTLWGMETPGQADNQRDLAIQANKKKVTFASGMGSINHEWGFIAAKRLGEISRPPVGGTKQKIFYFDHMTTRGTL